MSRVYLSWDEVERLIDLLIPQFQSEYDALMAITRGGIVPSGMIAERLNIPHVLTASVQFYSDEGAAIDWPIFLQFPSDGLLRDQNILVVDDIWDTGLTIMNVKERILAAMGSPELAVLHWKPTRSRFPQDGPDYYSAVTTDWIVYPWEPEAGRVAAPA